MHENDFHKLCSQLQQWAIKSYSHGANNLHPLKSFLISDTTTIARQLAANVARGAAGACRARAIPGNLRPNLQMA